MLELILLSLGLSCATGVLSLVASKARAASKTIAPIKAFDDNRFTYLKFKEQTDFPAAYRVQDGEETLLNSHVEDGWLVLHGVYEEVRLRAGKAVVGIYNENYQGGGASDKRAVSVKGLYRQIKHKE